MSGCGGRDVWMALRTPRRLLIASGGVARRHLWLGAAALTAACLCVFSALTVGVLWHPDGTDYAQIARELTEGHGFTSRQAIYALHLRFLKVHGLLWGDWPSLHRFPLPSLALAACFLVMGAGVSAVLAYGIAFQAATSALIFVWTRRAVGLAPAIVVVLLFSFNGAVMETGCQGLAEPVGMFFFTLSLFSAWRGLSDGRVRLQFWSGVALGLATLGRTDVVVAAPFLLLGIAVGIWRNTPRSKRPWGELGRRGGLFLVGIIVVLSPWLVRNLRMAGSPTFSLHSYFLLPAGTLPPATGDKWDVSLGWVSDFTPPLEYVRSHPGRVWRKWKHNAGLLLDDYPTLGGIRFLPVVSLLGLAMPVGRRMRGIAWLLFLSFAAHAALVCLTDKYMPRYHYYFLPSMLVVGVGVVWQALGRIPRHGARVAVLFLLVPVAVDAAQISEAARRARVWSSFVDDEELDFIRTHVDEDGVVFSDVSWAVTWATERRSIRSHYDRRPDGTLTLAVVRLNDEFLPIDAVYLKFVAARTRRAHQHLKEDPRFNELFPHQHRFPDGAVVYYR